MTLQKAPNVALTAVPQVVDLSKTERDPCAVKLQNESPYTLDISIGPDTHTLAAWMTDVFPTPGGITRLGLVVSSLVGAVAPPSAVLLITTAGAGDTIPGTFPAPLVRQTAPPGVASLLWKPGPFADNTTYATVVPLPPGTRSVMVALRANTNSIAALNNMVISGNESTIQYFLVNNPGGSLSGLMPSLSAVPCPYGPDTNVALQIATNGLGHALATGEILFYATPDLDALFAAATTGVFDVSDRAARLLGTLSARTGTWTTTLAAVPATTTTYFTLLAANAARKGVIIGTDSVVGGNLSLVQPGAAAGAGNGMFFLTAGNYPTGTWQMQEPIATGLLQAVTLAAGMSGIVRVTEIT